jgi:hypothetical protein
MGEIEEIIGITNKDPSELKSPSNNKTSIMTPSGGKMKRKHGDDALDEEMSGKKMASEKNIMGDKPEITITLKTKEAEVA